MTDSIDDYTISKSAISIIINGESLMISSQHQNYSAIREKLINNDFKNIKELACPVENFNRFGKGKIYVENGVVHNWGVPLKSSFADRIIKIWKEYNISNQTDKDLEVRLSSCLKFLANIKQNPEDYVEHELHLFMSENDLPLTEDGRLVAFKGVNKNYTDCYSGKFDNSVGSIVTMPRKDCERDRNQTCSNGLHFASIDYVNNFYNNGQNRIMAIAVNPKDIVSIPSDYNNQKGRCCKYEVLKEVDGQDLTSTLFTSSLYNESELKDIRQITDKSGRKKWQNKKTGKFVKAPGVKTGNYETYLDDEKNLKFVLTGELVA